MSRLKRRLAALAGMSQTELVSEWTRVYRAAAPALPADLLRLGIAYEQQKRKSGGLSRATRAAVKQQVEAPAKASLPSLRPGTCLVRTWHGKTHSVAVGHDGFTWDGRHYASLTAIAMEITGTRWSGPRFFGVKGTA